MVHARTWGRLAALGMIAFSAGAIAETPPRLSGSLTAAVQSTDHQQLVLGTGEIALSLTPRVALALDLGVVSDLGGPDGAWGFANPQLSVDVAFEPGPLHLDAIAGTTVPIGSGGGDQASPTTRDAMLSGTDWGGPMFAPNHVDLFGGMKLAAPLGALRLEAKGILNQAFRVRGDGVDSVGPSVTFLASSARASYARGGFTVFAEFLEIAILNTPRFVEMDPGARESRYLGAGLKVQGLFRCDLSPTLRYVRAIDENKMAEGFQVIELTLAI